MHFYDFVSYCAMLTDEARLNAYVGALKELVTPQSVVLDLGAGTGIFSVIACELGARKVYAIEVNPLIKLVEEASKARGLEGRLEIIQKPSQEVELGEKADIIVTDIHGGLPLHESALETIIDARERFLAPGGVLLPTEETIYFAPSESPDIYETQVSRYLQEFHGFKIPAADRLVRNRWFSAKSECERLLGDPAVFAVIDHRTNEESSFRNQLEWTITADGTIHGFRGWFENVLYGDWKVSNDITAEKSTYASPYFPLEEPVAVTKGDTVRASLSAVYEKETYAWSWRTSIEDRSGAVKASFDQTVMASLIIDAKAALKRNEFYTPALDGNGEVTAVILSKMDGKMMNGDIADLLLEMFPGKFSSFQEAIEAVYAHADKWAR